ncbi:hypothetical protein ACWGI8_10975 [Streptomyces sp. NPDC054841]
MEIAERAIEQVGGADSARSSNALADLRGQLAAHQNAHSVADFLQLTA